VVLLGTAAPVSMFMLAVIASTWFGGTKPGVLAMLVSAALLVHLLGADALLTVDTPELTRVASFVLIMTFVIWVLRSERLAAASLRRDIVAGKVLESDLRRTEGELRLAIDTMPMMAWTLLPDGKIEFLNRRWLDYAGMSLAEGIEQAAATIHPDDRERVLAKWREILATGAPHEDEIRLRRADGEYRWFLVRTVRLLDADGNVVRWYGTSTDIEDRKRAEEALRRSEKQLRESADRLQHLSRRLLEVQEEERRHLARELHDEFGQVLATVSLHLHAAKSAGGERARASLDTCMELLQRAGSQVRNLALELRPTMLETAGLDAALRWLADQNLKPTGIAVHLTCDVHDVPSDIAIACFRVAQEALTNVVRHADARNVWIDLSDPEGAVRLTIRDDGVGFEAAKVLERGAGGRLGLLGMRERVQILDGRLAVDSEPGRGTRIEASIPLERSGERGSEAT
jgi:PAS domain S-box-containing protein